jgi:3-methyl-2-oxobutanoate hydroxymethyltransferase
VIVKHGRVIAEGYHRRAGAPHAEVEALRRAGSRARGGTLYVTLEPCHHTGRTPPCCQAIIAAGIAVMGHVGLQPQTATVYRREGTTPRVADRIAREAQDLQTAGCFAVVIEAVPADLATRITTSLEVPVIGIAAGTETDGQVLVSTDLVGQLPFTPPFVTPKANVFDVVTRAAREFVDDVQRGTTVGASADDWPTLA